MSAAADVSICVFSWTDTGRVHLCFIVTLSKSCLCQNLAEIVFVFVYFCLCVCVCVCFFLYEWTPVFRKSKKRQGLICLHNWVMSKRLFYWGKVLIIFSRCYSTRGQSSRIPSGSLPWRAGLWTVLCSGEGDITHAHMNQHNDLRFMHTRSRKGCWWWWWCWGVWRCVVVCGGV